MPFLRLLAPSASRRVARAFAGCAIALWLLLPSVARAADPGVAPRPPLDVLFLISDDLNCAIGPYADSLPRSRNVARTPNLDRLAARGVVFERAYCQFPLCNPSRASLLTGHYPDTTTVHDNGRRFREAIPDVVTLPQLFRDAGGPAIRVGKLYHYGVPGQIGTDGLDDPPSWDRVVNPRGRDKDEEALVFSLSPGQYGGTLSWFAADGEDSEQTDGVGAREAVRLLEELAARRKSDAVAPPSFLAVGFYRPHTPYVAPKKYFEMYPLDSIELHSPDLPKGAPAACVYPKPEQASLTDDLRRQAIQAYLASITFMDARVGEVLDALERLGIAETTAVVFTSDHGYLLGEHGQWQKMSLFEPSARVPLIVAAPGRAGNGGRAAGLVELVDVHPTVARLAGLEPPTGLPGRDLGPILDDPSAPGRDRALTQLTRNRARRGARAAGAPRPGREPFAGYSIRTERHRYTEWDGGAEGVELYDHETDPDETINLADDPAHAETLARHRTMLAEAIRDSAPASR